MTRTAEQDAELENKSNKIGEICQEASQRAGMLASMAGYKAGNAGGDLGAVIAIQSTVGGALVPLAFVLSSKAQATKKQRDARGEGHDLSACLSHDDFLFAALYVGVIDIETKESMALQDAEMDKPDFSPLVPVLAAFKTLRGYDFDCAVVH